MSQTDKKNLMYCPKGSYTETRLVKAVFPGKTNHYQTLFGGTALEWMDEVAFISATRYGRKKFVTVSTDRIDFKVPIPIGSLVELIGEVVEVGRTSLVVKVSIYLEEMYSSERILAVCGEFKLVAINENKKPMAIWPEELLLAHRAESAVTPSSSSNEIYG